MTVDIYRNGEYLRHHPTWHAEDSDWKAAQISGAIRNFVGTGPKTLCEIGCGAGGVLRALQKMLPGCQCTGYDISPQAIALAKQLDSNVAFECRDVLSEDDGLRYDIAMAIDVFEHVENPFAFLRALKPKAPLKIFHIPLEWTVENTLRGHIIESSQISLGHVHFYTKTSALMVLQRCGYSISSFAYTPFLFEIPRAGLGNHLRRLIFRMIELAFGIDLAVLVIGGHSLLVIAE